MGQEVLKWGGATYITKLFDFKEHWVPDAQLTATGTGLPEAVVSDIDAASIVLRPGLGANRLRAMVLFPGGGGFTFSEEAADKFARETWPDLSDEQMRRCVKRLRLLVTRHMDVARHGPGRPATPWKDRY